MKLFLIRHGEAIKNVQNRHGQFANDLGLTEQGILDCKAIAVEIKKLFPVIHKIYTSEAKPAVETAGILSQSLNTKVIVLNNFKSLHYGIVCGLSTEEVRNLFPDISRQIELYNTNKLHPKDFTIPEMESLSSFENRINGQLNHILEIETDESIVIIIVHASTFNLLLNSIQIYPMKVETCAFYRYSANNLATAYININRSTRKVSSLIVNFNFNDSSI